MAALWPVPRHASASRPTRRKINVKRWKGTFALTWGGIQLASYSEMTVYAAPCGQETTFLAWQRGHFTAIFSSGVFADFGASVISFKDFTQFTHSKCLSMIVLSMGAPIGHTQT